MKIKNFSFTVLTLCTMLAAGSCKKTDDSGGGSLIGTWTLTELGFDANNNNAVDAGETTPVPASSGTNTINFKSDNTYLSVSASAGSSYTENGTYTYANGMIITKYNNSTPDTAHVSSLTSNKLVIKDKSSTPGGWAILTR